MALTAVNELNVFQLQAVKTNRRTNWINVISDIDLLAVSFPICSAAHRLNDIIHISGLNVDSTKSEYIILSRHVASNLPIQLISAVPI